MAHDLAVGMEYELGRGVTGGPFESPLAPLPALVRFDDGDLNAGHGAGFAIDAVDDAGVVDEDEDEDEDSGESYDHESAGVRRKDDEEDPPATGSLLDQFAAMYRDMLRNAAASEPVGSSVPSAGGVRRDGEARDRDLADVRGRLFQGQF
jgi:hypothetical protein